MDFSSIYLNHSLHEAYAASENLAYKTSEICGCCYQCEIILGSLSMLST